MKISYNWLKDYINIDQKPEELADELSLFGHEVDDIITINNDSIFDFEITPNRGDCLSIYGMAREIAALKNINIKNIDIKTNEDKINKDIKIKISDPNICPRFSARIIDNIEIKESPKWLQERLATYGFRPINNIVDITNYVMLMMGQPLHAFDYNKIKKGEINIRCSNKNEEVITLDGKNHILPENAIIINDAEKIYDLSGIMGGYKSEIDKQTTSIVLQAAIFDPILIRRASKYLHHQTDASYRYERGVDPEGTILALDIATNLIKESCPESKVGKLIDIKEKIYIPNKIVFDTIKINKLIGTKIDKDEIIKSLYRLGFIVKGDKVTVPSYRYYDVTLWQDIAEEVARIYGYNNIIKNKINKSKGNVNKEWLKRENIKDVCIENGFTEIYSYSFADKDKIEILGYNINDCVETINPISPELKYLRPSLLPSLLNQITKNPWAPEINIFEIEKVFEKDNEKWQLGIATVDKSDIMLKKVMTNLNIKSEIITINQNVLDKFKIRKPVKIILCDIDDINIKMSEINNNISENKYREVSKYPPTIRDLSFIVADSVASKKIEKDILEASSAILISEVFDEFKSDKFEVGYKNVAFHIWLQNMNGPVEEKEANKITTKIIELIQNKYNAKLRSK